MRTIRTAMVAMLVFAWVLLTSHCKIEAVPGFEFLRCSTDVHESAEQSEGGDPCEDAGCCSLESGRYYAPRQHDILPVAVSAIVSTERFPVVEQALPRDVSLGILTAAPPELAHSWQFISRTALSPRAPSFAS